MNALQPDTGTATVDRREPGVYTAVLVIQAREPDASDSLMVDLQAAVRAALRGSDVLMAAGLQVVALLEGIHPKGVEGVVQRLGQELQRDPAFCEDEVSIATYLQ